MKESEPTGAEVLLVFPGKQSRGIEFFSSAWPAVRAIADNGSLYRLFGLRRGKRSQLFGVEVWKRGWSAWRKGHRVGLPSGDPTYLPGAFLINAEKIVWEHRGLHAGDFPNWDEILKSPERWCTSD